MAGMKRRAYWWTGAWATGGAMAVLSLAASAQEPANASENIAAEAQSQLFQALESGSAREQYLSRLLAPLRRIDLNQDGLDAKDIERQTIREQATIRARAAQDFLRNDYDGDLTVTPAELIANAAQPNGFGPVEAGKVIAPFDINGDGDASLIEAMAAALAKRDRRNDRPDLALLALDPNGDGRLTAAELTALGEQNFARFDLDNDGVISGDEGTAIRETQMAISAGLSLREQGCVFPPVSAGAELVAFGAHGRSAASNVFVEHPSISTGVIDVEIERGDAPLFLILSSNNSVIWRFMGATERIEHVLANASASKAREDALADASASADPERRHALRRQAMRYPASAVGVVGLPKSKLTVVGEHCFRLPSRPPEELRPHVDRLARIISGRPADHAFGDAAPIRVMLPSGTFADAKDVHAEAPAGFDPDAWLEALRYSPGGLVTLEPASVVAAEPVGAHQVLPEQFGIAELIGSGALVRDEAGRLRLLRPIPAWPSGLFGAQRADFIVADGVVPPDGVPGHSCVLTEAEAAAPGWRQICAPKPANIQTRPSSPQPKPSLP